jgi:hypothetical protein
MYAVCTYACSPVSCEVVLQLKATVLGPMRCPTLIHYQVLGRLDHLPHHMLD